MKYLILSNVITFIINIYLLYRVYVLKKYSKQLFIRAWGLELKLLHIYNSCDPDIQHEIDKTLSDIKPL